MAVRLFRENWEDIRAEAMALPEFATALLAANGRPLTSEFWTDPELMGRVIAEHQRAAVWTLRQGTAAAPEWFNWGLIYYNFELSLNAARMPKTMALMKAARDSGLTIHKFGVSALAAGAALPPHNDLSSMPSAGAMTYHLCLAAPTKSVLRLLPDSARPTAVDLEEIPGDEIVFDARRPHEAFVEKNDAEILSAKNSSVRMILYAEIDETGEMRSLRERLDCRQ
jgi:hypothetical protein